MNSTSDNKKRGAIIGGSVGAAVVLIGMLALFSKGCGSGNGAKLTDSVYVYNNHEIPGTLYHGIDGSDYYIAVIPFGEEMTWQEAMALEKDGWLLPKSMGHFDGTDSDGEKNEGRMEYRTPDTDTTDPVIERMVGEPALLLSRVSWTGLPAIAGTGEFWTATELKANNAVYFSIRQYPDGVKMSSIVDSGDSKSDGKMVMLVKRIPSDTSLYTNPATGRKAQSVRINGYEVVDPSGGLGLAYLTKEQLKWANRYYFPDGTNDVTIYEVDGWHIPSLAEISAICGTEIAPGQTVNIGRAEDFLRVFPPSNSLDWTRYHIRDARGDFKALHVRLLNDGTVELTVRNTRSGAGMRMRLVLKGDGEAAAPVETTAAAVSDAEMMGLKGPVERVEEWFEFSEEPKRVMTFDAEGRLTVPAGITAVRDDLGRLTKYADERTPDSEDSFTDELTYDGDGLRPVSWTSANIGSFSTTKLTFSADGDLTSAHETSNLEGDEYVYFNFTTYTILARDEHGNWTKRQADVDESFAGAELSDHVCRTYVETRKITYRK